MNLLDTSTIWVDIFWISLNLAEGDSPGMYCIFDNEMYVLNHGDFIILCLCK